MIKLTENAIIQYCKGETEFPATLQVVRIKHHKKRTKVWISDGKHHIQGIIKRSKETSDSIIVNSIVKITDSMLHNVKDKKLFVILSFEVVEKNYHERIGNPVYLKLNAQDEEENTGSQKQQQQKNVRQKESQKREEEVIHNNNPEMNSQPKIMSNIAPKVDNGQDRMDTSKDENIGFVSAKNITPPQNRVKKQNPSHFAVSPSPNKRRKKKKGYGNPKYANPAVAINNTITEDQVRPLSELNMYDDWVIKVTVIDVGRIIQYNKGERSGKLQKANIMDEFNNQMEIVMFGKEVDKFGSMLEPGFMYLIGHGSLQHSNPQYSRHRFQIILRASSQVIKLEKSNANTNGVPKFDFIKLQDLVSVPDGNFIDVIAKIDSLGECVKRSSKKTGREFEMRHVKICDIGRDGRKQSVKVTFWNEEARDDKIKFQVGDIVAFKKVKKGSYSGVNLNTGKLTEQFVNPNIEEAENLRKAFDLLITSGSNDEQELTSQKKTFQFGNRMFQRRSNNYETIASFEQKGIGRKETAEYFMLKAYITTISTDRQLWYHSCPNEKPDGKKCMKKLKQLNSDGTLFACQKCKGEYQFSEKRYIFQVEVTDHTGSKWVTIFHQQGESLLKISPNDLEKLKASNYEEYEKKLLEIKNHPLIFNIKASVNNFRQENEIKLAATQILEIDYHTQNEKLLGEINRYLE